MMMLDQSLPIDAVRAEIAQALQSSKSAVLVAPPGAGKTTRVPLFLFEEAWARDQKLILLEPRRVAARAASERLAAYFGESPGATVGLRMRGQSLISGSTRIEVVTEGVFTRMVLDDPLLEGVACVIFDEFHERSLDADLGLALVLDTQAGLREDLRILIMSATLDGARVAGLLDGAAVVESQGRAYPVITHYLGRKPDEPVEHAAVRAVLRAWVEEPGSILVFLPGQGEIMRVEALLKASGGLANMDVCPLFSALGREEQARALGPAKPPVRKIVLATSIAETSLTIEGVRIVIDSGLARVPRYEPMLGLTRLETVRASRASADQRRGRAGRTQAGVCYRLWEEAGTGALPAYSTPEILAADLSGLMLGLASWGVSDPAQLRWLDPPPQPAVKEARALLIALGALGPEGRLTDEGKAMAELPLPPRLSSMLARASRAGDGLAAAEIAALLTERGLGGTSPDLAERLRMFHVKHFPRSDEARRLASALAQKAGGPKLKAEPQPNQAGRLLAMAFPDRVAKARGAKGEFLLANGRAGVFDPHEPLANEPYLAVAELTGKAARPRIQLAAALSEADIEFLFADKIVKTDDVFFDPAQAVMKARRRRRFGALILSEQNLSVTPSPDNALALAKGIAGLGLDRLPFTKALNQWRERILFLRQSLKPEEASFWPDFSDTALIKTIDSWLAPFIEARTSLAAITPDDVEAALKNLLPWELARRLDEEAPTHFKTPAGSEIALDYAGENAPSLAVKVQELYGLKTHPAIAQNRVPLTLELLSPAQRPIQVTRDLPGFWRGSWAGVKTEMRGRYPRHLWPDDPSVAEPTTRAKPRV